MIDMPMPDPTKPDPFLATVDGVRLDAYAALTASGPVHRFRFPSGVEGWLITGYDTARWALADPRFTKGGPGRGPFQDQLPARVVAAIDHHLLNFDPPDHTRLRRLLTAAFTRRRAEQLAPRIQELTDGLLDQLADRFAEAAGPVDLISEFAYPLPIAVICELLGIPEADRGDFRAWTGPLVNPTMFGFEDYAHAATSLVDYVHELIARKRRQPTDDLLSALIAVHDQGDRLTEDELASMVFLLLVAGHETTVNLIANGVRALLTHPEQWDLLRAEPERIGSAVEELLRYDGPLQAAIPTITSAPVEIDGVQVPAGEVVVISLLAANRDPAHLPGAEQLDITRPETSHLAFGHGIHRCVGAPLAQVEGRIALGSLIRRFERLELAVPAAELVRAPGLLMNGLLRLPVRVSAG
ncbi:MAG TPA: cytochrome P450 [Kineosporiaceae bacterium]|nr:cytochrome P450 [Kineosporiaceae bacterium]